MCSILFLKRRNFVIDQIVEEAYAEAAAECFFTKGAMRNFTKFARKHQYLHLCFNNVKVYGSAIH